jgi:hypothetical protein
MKSEKETRIEGQIREEKTKGEKGMREERDNYI